MTQPIQEPSTDRALQGVAYQRDQLLRRPAPTAAASTTSAYADDLLANGTGADVGNDNWELVVTGVDGANDRWLDEFNYDPDNDWSIAFGDGAIHNAAAVAYNYSMWGYLVFDGTIPDGSILGVAVAVGGEFHINTITVEDAGVELGVYVERTPLGILGARMWAYQNTGGSGPFLAAARLHVRRFELYEDVYIQEFAT